EWWGYDLYQAMLWFVFAGGPLPYVGTPLNGVTPIYRQFEPENPDVEVAGVQVEYGAYDRFSGFSSMSSWVVDTTRPDGYILGPYPEPPRAPTTADFDPYRKLQLR